MMMRRRRMHVHSVHHEYQRRRDEERREEIRDHRWGWRWERCMMKRRARGRDERVVTVMVRVNTFPSWRRVCAVMLVVMTTTTMTTTTFPRYSHSSPCYQTASPSPPYPPPDSTTVLLSLTISHVHTALLYHVHSVDH